VRKSPIFWQGFLGHRTTQTLDKNGHGANRNTGKVGTRAVGQERLGTTTGQRPPQILEWGTSYSGFDYFGGLRKPMEQLDYNHGRVAL
jgi:hypothetical protein